MLDRRGINKESSLEWLIRGKISWDGERVIINAQDQRHQTNGLKKLVGSSQLERCRFCKIGIESTFTFSRDVKKNTSEHQYTQRNNKLRRIVHWCTCLQVQCDELYRSASDVDDMKLDPGSLSIHCNFSYIRVIFVFSPICTIKFGR